MTVSDAQPAASSAADPIDAAVASGDQAAYGAAKRAARTPSSLATPPADSSPAAPVEQVASTEALPAPASEPADSGKGKGAKARSAELDVEIQALQERLRLRAALRAELDARDVQHDAKQDAQSAGSSPAASSSPAIDLAQPPLTEAAFFAAHPDLAYGEHVRYLARYDRAQERAEETQQRETHDRVTTYAAIEEAATAAYPDFAEKLTAATAAKVHFSPAIMDVLLWHPQASDLAYALVSNLDQVPRLSALSPEKLGFALAALLPSAAPAVASATPTITHAPKPPTILGRKAVESADPIESAVASGDQAAFRAARLRQRLATQR